MIKKKGKKILSNRDKTLKAEKKTVNRVISPAQLRQRKVAAQKSVFWRKKYKKVLEKFEIQKEIGNIHEIYEDATKQEIQQTFRLFYQQAKDKRNIESRFIKNYVSKISGVEFKESKEGKIQLPSDLKKYYRSIHNNTAASDAAYQILGNSNSLLEWQRAIISKGGEVVYQYASIDASDEQTFLRAITSDPHLYWDLKALFEGEEFVY